MLKKCLFLVTVVLTAAAVAFAQGTFTPRDTDEEQAWRIYNAYKESRRIEAPLEAQIKAKFNDALMAAYGALAGKAVDPGDVAEVRALREKMEAERERQAALLAIWEKKFYWRYGDLRWSNEKIYDPKTKRQMDRIEFALIYFPFNYKPAVKPPAVVKPPVKPPIASTSIEGSYSGTLTGDCTGILTFVVKGTSITGKFSGASGPDRWPLIATFTGSVRTDGQMIDARITGTVSGNSFTGTLFGNLSGGNGSGIFKGITVSQRYSSTSYHGYLGGDWTAGH